MVSAYRSPVVARFESSCQPLGAFQSPCCQRRLPRSSQCLIPIALPRESVFAKLVSLATSIAAVSHWLAPEGAKQLRSNRPHPVVPKGSTPHLTFGSWSKSWKANPARRFAAAASRASAASLGAASAGWEASSPRTGLAPTHPSTGRCAIKPRRAGYVKRWAS